jgi:hypothetical protein
MQQPQIDAILSQSAPHLTHLELHNLLQWSHLDPPLPAVTSSASLLDYWKHNFEDHLPTMDSRLMSGALDPYIGRCAHLTSLCIATTGFGGYDEWQDISEWQEQRYDSWVRFIDSVRAHLRHLTFKQGVDRNMYAGSYGSQPGRAQQNWTDLDLYFRRHILPVLLSAPWPAMQRMQISGVGKSWQLQAHQRWPNTMDLSEPGIDVKVQVSTYGEYIIDVKRPAFSHEDREKVRALMPMGAELVVSEEMEGDYEYLYDSDCGLPHWEGERARARRMRNAREVEERDRLVEESSQSLVARVLGLFPP